MTTSRLSVEIPTSLKRRLERLPHGMIRAVTIVTLNDALDAIEGPNENAVLGGILTRNIKLADYSETFSKDAD
ncbi:MAG: hypothetical protein CO041_04325 [Candidatus Pacebacteria bacterium CG_4_9_14_0_2_um_filter_40_15]|nr:MAG: hypothetical protein COY01_02995 [Candidatus Pacebacteria bacterium CG_4_10_14_0_2_um_filter_40_20]PJC41501.1 MAG: hypothetical protein CO041_04325 [Candidatus Pacebacteria bacterium CG_4_9_14_0_2_um_filter_40_15]